MPKTRARAAAGKSDPLVEVFTTPNFRRVQVPQLPARALASFPRPPDLVPAPHPCVPPSPLAARRAAARTPNFPPPGPPPPLPPHPKGTRRATSATRWSRCGTRPSTSRCWRRTRWGAEGVWDGVVEVRSLPLRATQELGGSQRSVHHETEHKLPAATKTGAARGGVRPRHGQRGGRGDVPGLEGHRRLLWRQGVHGAGAFDRA